MWIEENPTTSKQGLNGNETPTGTGLTVLRNHPHGITNEATLAIISRTDVIGCPGYFHK